MAATNLSLTTEERELLIRMLDTALGEARVEVHHTHFSPEFREYVQHQESLIRQLLERLRTGGAGAGGGPVPT